MKRVFFATLFASAISFAHEGHNHAAPTFAPPNGGVIKSTEDKHFELVFKKDQVEIQAFDLEGKRLKPMDVKVSAQIERPRKKKEDLPLEISEKAWSAKIDAQGAHRLTVHLKIHDKHEDVLKWTIEPKK